MVNVNLMVKLLVTAQQKYEPIHEICYSVWHCTSIKYGTVDLTTVLNLLIFNPLTESEQIISAAKVVCLAIFNLP